MSEWKHINCCKKWSKDYKKDCKHEDKKRLGSFWVKTALHVPDFPLLLDKEGRITKLSKGKWIRECYSQFDSQVPAYIIILAHGTILVFLPWLNHFWRNETKKLKDEKL